MKKVLLIIALIIANLTVSAAFSQNQQGKPRLSREEMRQHIFNAQVKEMQTQLKLTDDQLTSFIPVYRDYCKAIAAIKRPDRPHKRPGDFTQDDAVKFVQGDIEFKKDILDVQSSFIDKFKEVLTPSQLARLSWAENEVQNIIRQQHMKRMHSKKKDAGQ